MINVAPGGLLLIAAFTTTPSSQLQEILIKLNFDAMYSMIAAVAGLWAASYVGTAIAMHYIKKYGKK